MCVRRTDGFPGREHSTGSPTSRCFFFRLTQSEAHSTYVHDVMMSFAVLLQYELTKVHRSGGTVRWRSSGRDLGGPARVRLSSVERAKSANSPREWARAGTKEVNG